MQVKVDILEGLQRKLTIEIPAAHVDEKVMQELQKAQKNAKIDGFRKGKIPMNIIRQKYGVSIRQDALSKLMESSYSNAIKQENLTPAGQPEINPVSGAAANEPFVYEVTLEIIPEFSVKGQDSLTIKKPISAVSEQDIDKMIETLRKQAADWEKSANSAREGDRITIDFSGKIDGEPFEGSNAEDLAVVLGEKQMLSEFEAALYQQKSGDKITTNVNFPKDYHGKDVAGKSATFDISIKTVESPVLPEVDSDFIKKFGIEDGKPETLSKAIRKNMERELQDVIRDIINKQVLQHLLDANHIMIPESMVTQEKERLAHKQKLSEKVSDANERQKIIDETFDEPARRRVTLGLIMTKLFEEKQIKPDPKRVEARIKSIASTYENPHEAIEYYNKNSNASERIYAEIMEEQLIDSLLAKAEIVEEQKTFDEVMQRKP